MFPIYLFPAVPFRRRRKAAIAAAKAASPGTFEPSHLPTGDHLRGSSSLLRCGRCAADLCPTSAIVSRGFTGRWGRAYLVAASPELTHSAPAASSLPNTHLHKPVARQLVTGAHTVSDVSCALCAHVLGWKYVDAEEESQRYKVGKFILETRRVSVATCWEQEDVDWSDEAAAPGAGADAEAVEFDSQDEDECEDLFAGMWSPASAAKRRKDKAKVFGGRGPLR